MGAETWGFWVLVAGWASAVFWFDATTARIPNWLTLPAIVVTWGACALLWLGWIDFWGPVNSPVAIWGGVLWWGAIVIGGVAFPRHAAGAADAKLAAVLGVFAAGLQGVLGVLLCWLIAGLLGVCTGVLWGRRTEVPQGPAMILAVTLVAVWSAL